MHDHGPGYAACGWTGPGGHYFYLHRLIYLFAGHGTVRPVARHRRGRRHRDAAALHLRLRPTPSALLLGSAPTTTTADPISANSVRRTRPCGVGGDDPRRLSADPTGTGRTRARGICMSALMGGLFGAALMGVSLPILRPLMLYIGFRRNCWRSPCSASPWWRCCRATRRCAVSLRAASASCCRWSRNSRHIVVRYGAHTTSNPCLDRLITSFIEAGTAKSLDASCVNDFKRPPFLTDASVKPQIPPGGATQRSLGNLAGSSSGG